MKNLCIFTVLLVAMLNSCKYDLIQDVKASKELVVKYHGRSGGIYYVHDKLTNNIEQSHFIKFIIKGSEIAHFEESKEAYAPSIAIELFKNLSHKTIANNYGIEIVFDSSNFNEEKKYFYLKEDLEIVNYNIARIKELINESINDKQFIAYDLIDTTIFDSNIDSSLNRLKNIYVTTDKSRTLYSYYKHDNYDGDSNTLDKYFEIFIFFQNSSGNIINVSIACLPIKKKRSIIGVYF